MNEYMEVYIAEGKELLDEMNDSLLKLEKNIGDSGLINNIFRAAHTIKGNSASMGFKRMENLTHTMEDVLQDIRDGKVEIDGKIMELLFVGHDFLESGLYSIMQTGNEEEMKIDEILGKLHSIIGEKHGKLKSETVSNMEKSLDYMDLTLNSQELGCLKKDIDEGFNTYLIKITLASDCIFKAVRVFMWFQEMDAYLKVIRSDPNRPAADDLKNNAFSFEGTAVKLFAASKDETRQLLGKLNKMLDVENIYVEPVRLKDSDFMEKQIKLVMTKAAVTMPDIEKSNESTENAETADEMSKEKERLIEIDSEFSKDFINEISAQLFKTEAEFQTIERKPGNNNTFYKLSRLYHTISGLAGFIDNSLMSKISVAAGLLAEYYRKGDPGSGNVKITLLRESTDLIKALCSDKELIKDKSFIDNTGRLIQELKKEICCETPAEEADDIAISCEYELNNEAARNIDIFEKEEAPHEEKSALELHNQVEQEMSKNAGKSLDSSFMRISAQKVDTLVDMLGELLILHSLMEQDVSDSSDTKDRYSNDLLRMAKIIKGLQNLSMSLRMVSLKQALQKTMRVGRDTAAELGKMVNICITGEETEIDRNIADKLVDPLMHLVRNAVSHGIEDEKERSRKGKPETGNVNVRAFSKRGYVYIEVEDDGSGLPLDKIREKAIRKNLIDPQADYTSEEIISFIFLPGFSTQETVNNISGRGVGMNVVETEIKKVGGKIEILNMPGEGCKFILKIPLNLAVMNGTIVDICGGRYIIPTLYIKQFIKPDESQWVKVKNKKTMIRVRDELIRIIPVERVFGLEEPLGNEDENMVIIIEVEQKFKALPVRSVIGRQEIVAKPLGKEFNGLDFASGASILGDGKVSLIIDVEAVFKISGVICERS